MTSQDIVPFKTFNKIYYQQNLLIYGENVGMCHTLCAVNSKFH